MTLAPRNAQAAADDLAGGPDPWAGWNALDDAEHFVQFYESDECLVASLAQFVGAALRGADTAVVVATAEHRAALDQRLAAAGVDLAVERAVGRYIALDAAETLAGFMVDGWPDPDRFAEVIGGLVTRAAEGGRGVRIFGEMVALLAREGHQAAALRLEQLWNELHEKQPFSLFCAYPMADLAGEPLASLVAGVCTEHSHVVPAESYSQLPTPDARLREITALQQKAAWLEAEIMQRKRAEQRLLLALESERVAREAAETALHLRNEFLSIASHELRTPLTALSTHAQLVLRRLDRDGSLEPAHAERALRTITNQVGKLDRLLTQLLDISRLEGGRLTLAPEPTDLVTLVEQTVSATRLRTDRHRISLETPPSLQAWVDPLRLEQVLTNLLDNALKYSPGGGAIEVVLSSPGPELVELSVRDHGLGIAPERRAKIFERFYQAHPGSSHGGMGLGLYISQQIVERHGGEIRADFPPDGGTRVVVRLPLAQPDVASVPSSAAS